MANRKYNATEAGPETKAIKVDGEKLLDPPGAASVSGKMLETQALALIVDEDKRLRKAMAGAVDDAFREEAGGFFGIVAKHTLEVMKKEFDDEIKGAKIKNETIKIAASMIGIPTSNAGAQVQINNLNAQNGRGSTQAREMTDEELERIAKDEEEALDAEVIDVNEGT